MRHPARLSAVAEKERGQDTFYHGDRVWHPENGQFTEEELCAMLAREVSHLRVSGHTRWDNLLTQGSRYAGSGVMLYSILLSVT